MSETNEPVKRRRRATIAENPTQQESISETSIPLSTNTVAPPKASTEKAKTLTPSPLSPHHVSNNKKKHKKRNLGLITFSIIEGLIIAILVCAIILYVHNGWTENSLNTFIAGIVSTPSLLPIPSTTPSPTPSTTPSPTATPTPSPTILGGIYEAEGYNGLIKAAIYFNEEGIVTSAYLIESNEDPQYASRVFSEYNVEKWIDQDLSELEIDTITGCTITTNALKWILAQAKLDDYSDVIRAMEGYRKAVEIDKHFQTGNGLEFGMTRDDVIAIEGIPEIEQDEMLVYSVEVSGLDAKLLVHMTNSVTDGYIYAFTETHSSNNLYIKDFLSIDKLLRETYIDSEHTMIWIDEFYKNRENYYGLAVSKGDLQYANGWEFDSVTIIHTLSGDNYVPEHVLCYYSPDHVTSSSDKSRL